MLAILLPVLSILGSDLQVSPQDTLDSHGLSVLLFHNSYHSVFGDEKMSGLEIILHERRIATNGDVRLSPTPEQWDPIPEFKERKRGPTENELTAYCVYPGRDLSYHVAVQPEANGFRVAVQLDQPLPAALAAKAGFNLEFLPTAYFGKTYLLDDQPGIFPRHPDGPMSKEADGSAQPQALAEGPPHRPLSRRSPHPHRDCLRFRSVDVV